MPKSCKSASSNQEGVPGWLLKEPSDKIIDDLEKYILKVYCDRGNFRYFDLKKNVTRVVEKIVKKNKELQGWHTDFYKAKHDFIRPIYDKCRQAMSWTNEKYLTKSDKFGMRELVKHSTEAAEYMIELKKKNKDEKKDSNQVEEDVSSNKSMVEPVEVSSLSSLNESDDESVLEANNKVE